MGELSKLLSQFQNWLIQLLFLFVFNVNPNQSSSLTFDLEQVKKFLFIFYFLIIFNNFIYLFISSHPNPFKSPSCSFDVLFCFFVFFKQGTFKGTVFTVNENNDLIDRITFRTKSISAPTSRPPDTWIQNIPSKIQINLLL